MLELNVINTHLTWIQENSSEFSGIHFLTNMDQEQIMQLQMIEQEANQINQQLEIIEQNISELQELKSSLEEIEKMGASPSEDGGHLEILANLGKRIYIPVEIKDKTLIVEVGNKNFVKKSIPETKNIIENQLEKLEQLRTQLAGRTQDLGSEMNNLVNNLNSGANHKCKHGHNHECDCDDSECECEEEED